MLIGSESAAQVIGADPVARIAGRAAYALEPQFFGYAPVEAANSALKRAGIGWGQVGAVELNEAFAVQSLACVDAWGIDPENSCDHHCRPGIGTLDRGMRIGRCPSWSNVAT